MSYCVDITFSNIEQLVDVTLVDAQGTSVQWSLTWSW